MYSIYCSCCYHDCIYSVDQWFKHQHKGTHTVPTKGHKQKNIKGGYTCNVMLRVSRMERSRAPNTSPPCHYFSGVIFKGKLSQFGSSKDKKSRLQMSCKRFAFTWPPRPHTHTIPVPFSSSALFLYSLKSDSAQAGTRKGNFADIHRVNKSVLCLVWDVKMTLWRSGDRRVRVQGKMERLVSIR